MHCNTVRYMLRKVGLSILATGASAADAASRNGRSVLLTEKSIMLAGLAAIGYVYIYLSLCDGP